MGLLSRLRLYRDEYRTVMSDTEKALGKRLVAMILGATAAAVAWVLTRKRSK